MKRTSNCLVSVVLISLILLSIQLPHVYANSTDENKYYLGQVFNAGKNSGYSEEKVIDDKDPHFGWSIGDFFVTGYSATKKDEDGTPVFLKNIGDKVTLWFCLDQDIDKLNDNKKMSIAEDKKGYDKYFQIKKTDFGKGALIIQKKDYENYTHKPVLYTNFLAAQTSKYAYTQVEFLEEGDYEVALNYVVQKANLNVFGWKPFSSQNDYRIYFRFSVRNGNCMAYPFDVRTRSELSNASFTENGFYLDLANSKYLDINIKKEVINESEFGLVEDTRFNRPVKEWEEYTEEGIYTITVKNQYTEEETVKKIYVGTDDVLKAHVTTGFTIEEIKKQISLGAIVNSNGELISASQQGMTYTQIATPDEPIAKTPPHYDYTVLLFTIMVVAFFVVFISLVVVLVVRRNNMKVDYDNEERDDG